MTEEALAHDQAVLGRAPDRASSRDAIKVYLPLAAVIALAILVWIPRLSGPIDLRWDAGVYYLLGSSLATGQGYRILSEPGTPEALQYPPLLPAIVAIYQRALGSTEPGVVGQWLRFSYAGLFLGYALALFALARRYLRPTFALVATALCLLHVWTIFISDLLFAELPFTFFSVLFALFAASSAAPGLPAWRREVGSFICAAAAFLLRTAGVALIAAWVIEALARRRWVLALARALLGLLPIVLWQAHVEHVRQSHEYQSPAYEYQRAPYQNYNVSYGENAALLDPTKPQMGRVSANTLAARLVRNVRFLAKALGEAVSTSDGYWRQALSHAQQSLIGRQPLSPGVVSLPIVGLTGLIVVGLVLLARGGAWMMVLIVLTSLGLICTTPWAYQFQRYLVPVTPFLAICAMVSLSKMNAVLCKRKIDWAIVLCRVAIVSLLGLIFTLQLYTDWGVFQDRRREGASSLAGTGAEDAHFIYHDRAWREWDKAVNWIRTHAAPGAIIATPASHFLYLWTGHPAVAPPMEQDPIRARHLLEAVPASYVIIDNMPPVNVSRRYALPAVLSDPVGWQVVYATENTTVYGHSTGLQ